MHFHMEIEKLYFIDKVKIASTPFRNYSQKPATFLSNFRQFCPKVQQMGACPLNAWVVLVSPTVNKDNNYCCTLFAYI